MGKWQPIDVCKEVRHSSTHTEPYGAIMVLKRLETTTFKVSYRYTLYCFFAFKGIVHFWECPLRTHIPNGVETSSAWHRSLLTTINENSWPQGNPCNHLTQQKGTFPKMEDRKKIYKMMIPGFVLQTDECGIYRILHLSWRRLNQSKVFAPNMDASST